MASVADPKPPGKNPVAERNCGLTLTKAALTMKSFIFSNKLAPRLTRHLAFWGLYFAGTLLVDLPDIRRWGYTTSQVFERAFYDAISYLPIYLTAVYTTIYLILPIYLRKRKLSLLLWYALVLFTIAIPAGYYVTEVNYTNRGYDADVLDIFATALHNCMANLITITGAAVIIRIMKDYWLRQRESEHLAIENVRNKLYLLKMQMHPRILFGALQKIHAAIDDTLQEAPEMILILSDLLSYLLYESDSDQVPLSKEVQMIENYLALKKLEFNRQVDLRFETNGQLSLYWITPGLFLPLLEIAIEGRGNSKHLTAVNVQLKTAGPKIHFSLTSDTPGATIAKDPIVQTTLRTVRERLNSADFQKCKLILQPGPNNLNIALQLEKKISKLADLTQKPEKSK
jgi:sensor histidine kinase YesM